MKVLVIGAGGFIGAWVAEYLHLSARAEPRLAVRNPKSLVRTARFGMTDIATVDVMDRAGLISALQGVDVVFDCAMVAPAMEKEGAENIAWAMREAGVRRLVYLSSVAVYGDIGGVVTEDTTAPAELGAYASGKRDAEAVLLTAKDIDVTVLRPTLVYGPYGTVWSETVGRRVVSGRWGKLGRYGDGTCNLVYVQDVAEAMMSCVDSPASIGKAYNINGAERPTWNEYWSRLSMLLAGRDLPFLDLRRLMLRTRLLNPVRQVGKMVLQQNREFVMKIYGANQLTRSIFKSTEGNLKLFPPRAELDSYSRVVSYPADRLTADTGFVPRTSFEEGTALSADWLRLIGVV